ncbi:dystroglycan 1-like [Tiliqua scincoides]|uniref:dystroglycan 1-like n=1 Tax=Tiliqua scincoides TaxID=71010 RepID=UPI003462FB40
MSDLSLASSFGTKVNFQITRELTSEQMKESTILYNKETPSRPGFYATSLYHGAQGQTNTSPRIVNAIKWLTATIGHKFSFSIPPDTFYDQEDGNTTQLTLGMNPADYSATGLESWLQFNSHYQTLYGYPLDHDFQYSPQEYLLFATDSGGLRASDTLTIELLRPTITPCHVYTIRTKNSYHSFLRNRERISLFFEKLSIYLNAGSPGNMTLLDLRPGSTVITWYNKSICTRTNNWCATDEIQRVQIKLVLPGGKVNPDFAEAMLPEYKIDQIEDIAYGGICLDIEKPLNESLPPNRTLSTFKDSRSWIRNILFALLISVSTTVMVILIITFHYCKYHKKVSGLQSASFHARPFSCVDFEMNVLKSRKPPILDQEAPQAAQPWLHMPPPSQPHRCRPKRTLTVSRLPPPPKYRLPPSYGMEESGQSCRDHGHRMSYPKARLY